MLNLKMLTFRMLTPNIETFRTLMAPFEAQIHIVSAASQPFFRAEPKWINLCWPWFVCQGTLPHICLECKVSG